jgi:hypothetical protein
MQNPIKRDVTEASNAVVYRETMLYVEGSLVAKMYSF